MSRLRTTRGGWVQGKGRRGPNGRGICRRCRVEVPRGRRTFCGDACVAAWRIRTDAGYLREQVLARDRGICAACGLHTIEFFGRLAALAPRARARLRRKLDIGIARKSFWDADHIVAVAEGGGECDLDNIRTLCLWCHLDATARLRRRLAAAGRAPDPQGTRPDEEQGERGRKVRKVPDLKSRRRSDRMAASKQPVLREELAGTRRLPAVRPRLKGSPRP